jgi:hypothetical protein
MASHSDKTRGQLTCVVDLDPEVVDAGAELTLHFDVSCAPACDLRGHAVLIKDQGGADRGSIELTRFDGETNETGDLVVKAPVTAGGYMWLAVCPAVVKERISYTEASTPISFNVKPHTTSLIAWDTPSAIVAGERFRIKVGIKCSSECHLNNSHFEIYDHKGTQVATGTLPGDIWPGTTGLYFAEVELQAPAEDGFYTWSGKCPGLDDGLPHAEGSVSFGVRVVSRPEYVVKVETVDKVSQTPLSGARVVMHPYRAVTDERGVAEVRVAKGAYKLFVSQTSYITFGLALEVTADVTARAELDLEPVPERN